MRITWRIKPASTRHTLRFTVLGVAVLAMSGAVALAQTSPYLSVDGPNVTVDLSVLDNGGYGGPAPGTIVYTPGGRPLLIPDGRMPRSKLLVTPTGKPLAPEPAQKVRLRPPSSKPRVASRPRATVKPRVAAKPPVAAKPAVPVKAAPLPKVASAPSPASALPPKPAKRVAMKPPAPITAPTPKPMEIPAKPTVKMAPKKDPMPAPAPAKPVAAPVKVVKPAPKMAVASVPPPPPPPKPMTTARTKLPAPPPVPAIKPVKPTPAPVKVATKQPATASLPPASKPEAMGKSVRVVFAPSASKLPATAGGKLKALAEVLKGDAKLRLQLMAFAGADAMSPSKARRLALSRALSVRSHLIESGVRSTRIDVRALGNKTKEEPINRVDVNVIER
jgi:outer membrane protein OmpA-like peptidoglycan-associated protein